MSSIFWNLETMFQDKEEDQSEIQKHDCVSYIVIYKYVKQENLLI
jgi:hypothetical protein